MCDLPEIRVIIKSLVRTGAKGCIKLYELEKWYHQQEGGEKLANVSSRFGFKDTADMIRSWPEFEVYGQGLSTTVQAKDQFTK